MPGKLRYSSLLMMACSISILEAQELPLSSQYLEDLLYRNESAIIPETFFSEDPESYPFSVDLNNVTEEELEATGLFTPYQLYQLLSYRSKYGPFYSIYELAALPGFHSSLIKDIDSLIQLYPIQGPVRKVPAKHMILVNMERIYRASAGKDIYDASLLKSSIRVRSQAREKLFLALTFEKDSGEPFTYRKRPQFLSGNLSYRGTRFVKQLLLGNFQLNHGLGLVNGSGFLNRAGNFRADQQSISRIKPYASVSENSFEQGIAGRMGTDRLQLMLWLSCHRFSLSSSAFTENSRGHIWLDYQRTSGLFRTGAELDSRDLAYRIHSGIQLIYRQKGLALGIMSGREWFGLSKEGKGMIKHPPASFPQHNFSVHGNWNKKKIQIFGELASGEFQSAAILIGSTFSFNDFVQANLLLHHYGEEFHGSLPSSYGSGSNPRGEQGLAVHLHLETGKEVSANFTSELFRYPSPRYMTRTPSIGYRIDLSLHNPPSKMIQWRARLVSKTWQTTQENEASKIRILQESRVNRIDCQLSYLHSQSFKWQSRLVVGFYSRENYASSGYAAMQQLSLNFRHFRARAQFVLFHIKDWQNRVYLYEPGFYYSFNFPAYYGSGQKTTLLITLKTEKYITLSVKISGMLNNGNRIWETGIQMRVNL